MREIKRNVHLMFLLDKEGRSDLNQTCSVLAESQNFD